VRLPSADELRTAASLARWLGPWAGESIPTTITRREVAIRRSSPTGGEAAVTFRAYLYAPRRPTAALLVAPGLHFAGPDDPRLDRFCRVLAAAGHLVLCPFLPSFTSLLVEEVTTDDLVAAFDDLERRASEAGLPPPAIVSISFGALPTAALCARPSHRQRVGGWLSFGGYCDFGSTIRFALSGRLDREDRALQLPHDPLNAPVVILNVLPFLGDQLGDDVDRGRLADALREVAYRTWGKMELKVPGARDHLVHGVADTLPGREKELCLVASGILPGGLELLEAGLARAGDAFGFADPRPHLRSVEVPVAVVHGRDDDVIPWVEAEKLVAALPAGQGRLHLTGLYGHTGSLLPHPRDALREARTLAAILLDLAAAPRRRRWTRARNR
jgi:pimeloyl-ACP methyl ester carboxylesterase